MDVLRIFVTITNKRQNAEERSLVHIEFVAREERGQKIYDVTLGGKAERKIKAVVRRRINCSVILDNYE